MANTFLEVINCLYCSGTAWIHRLGKWSSWQGSLDWLQAAVPGLGAALALVRGPGVRGFLPQLGCGKEHTAQNREEEIAGWLCQGIAAASASQAVAQSSGV